MKRKTEMDLLGASALVLFALNLAFNQVVIKVTTGGFNPIFAVGLRSVGALFVLLAWMRWRGIALSVPRGARRAALLSGLLFTLEFIFLFGALDLTTVSRASVIFYSMPVWTALSAHLLLPGEQLTRGRMLGLVLAMAGVALALLDRSGAQVSWTGDLMALLAAFCWAGIVLVLRLTPLSEVPSEQQLFWQVAMSVPIFLVLAPLAGPLVRDLAPIHLWAMIYQILLISSFGYLSWFWFIKIYPANAVTSFSFLSPVLSVILGWLLLSERVAPSVWAALGLVAVGISLINRRSRRLQVPQKVAGTTSSGAGGR